MIPQLRDCIVELTDFPLYPTDSCLHTEHSSNVFTKFADNMITGVRLISNEDETDYRSEVNHLAMWHTDNNLGLNVAKTKRLL